MEKITPEIRKEAKKFLKNGNLQEFFELFFSHVNIIYRLSDKGGLEMETWTDCGVNMIVCLNSDEGLLEEFKDYVKNFDVDEEIDFHREDDRYKREFTIRESLEDFENYLKWLNKIVGIIEKAGF